MNRSRTSALAASLIALLTIGAALACSIKWQPAYGTVAGRVVMSESGKPLAGVHIYLNPGHKGSEDSDSTDSDDDYTDDDLEGSTSEGRRIATTDAAGRFTLPRVEAGAYHLSAESRYHNCEAVDITVAESAASDSTLLLKRSESDLALGDYQSVWSLKERPKVPVRGYVDAARGGKDKLHLTIYKTRLSAMLTDKDTADAFQKLVQRWEDHPSKLPSTLLHPRSAALHGGDPRPVGTIDVPISAPDREGFFEQRLVIPSDGPGVYLVQIEHGGSSRCAWVLSTNSALVLKQAGRQQVAFAVDLNSGSPIAGAQVKQYRDGVLLASATTSHDGIAEMQLPAPPKPKKNADSSDSDGGSSDDGNPDESRVRMVTIAECGADEAVLNLDSYSTGDAADGDAVYAYTDRTVYRPGQAIAYKGIIRRHRPMGAARPYDVPPAGTKVTIDVRDPSGDRLLHEQKSTNKWGTIDGGFTLSPEAPTGSYSLITTVDGEKHTTDIAVASYRKPEYSVTVKPKKSHYVRGEKVEMVISAQYYYGAPVAGGAVEYSLYRDTDWSVVYADDDDPEDRDSDEQNSFYGELLTEGKVTLDANGQATVSVDTDRKTENEERRKRGEDPVEESASAESDKPDQQIVTCDANVTDDAQREVESKGQAHLSSGDYILTASPEGYLGAPGQPTSVVVTARDYGGKPVPNLAVYLSATYLHWNSNASEEQRVQAGLNQRAVTGAGGSVVLAVTPRTTGELNLLVTAYDTAERVMHGHADIYVCNDSGGDLDTNYSDLSLFTDKKKYGPTDTARVLINTARTGETVWLAVEGDKVYKTMVVPILHASTVVSVPIEADWGPNVTLSACYVRNKKYAESTANLRVRLDRQMLNVSVKADRDKYRPGDKVTYSIQTTRADNGLPVSSEVSLAVVDESIFALRFDDPYGLRDAFFPERTDQVNTSYSFAVQYLGDTDKSEPTIEMRRKFLDTAFWQPHVETGSDGRATVTVPLPDNLTTWRATVQAVTMDTAVGRSIGKVLETKPFFVRLDTPRFLTQSDDGRLLTLLHNDTGLAQTVHVRMTAPGLLPADAKSLQTLEVAPASDGQIDWPIQANRIGTAPIRVEAWTDGHDPTNNKPYTDGIETSLPVRAWGREQFTQIGGVVPKEGAAPTGPDNLAGVPTRPIDIDPYAIPAETKLTLRFTPNVTASVTPALEYLVGYPYGCTEQTMSRMLPDLLVQRIEQQTGHSILRGPEAAHQHADLAKMVQNGILRLRRFQHKSGAWGWWENDTDNAQLTGYALYGLALAKEQGFAVPEAMLANGRKGALAQLKEASSEDRPLLMYALSLAGDTGEPLRLLRAVNAGRTRMAHMTLKELEPDSLAYLVLLAKRTGGDYTPAWSELQRREGVQGALVHWRARYGRWNSSDLMATAAALRAMLAVDPRDSRVDSVLHYLMLRRSDGYWADTRDTASVLEACTDYLALHPEDAAPASGIVSVSVDGKSVAQLDLGAPINSQETEYRVDIPASALPRGKHTLTVNGAGVKGTVFYSGALRQIVATKEGALPPLPAREISVEREYLRVDSTQKPDGLWSLSADPVPGAKFQQDDHLRVRLTIIAKHDVDYVLIEDQFPSNCEPTQRGTDEDETDGSDWNFWYSNVDVRDDRIAYFATHLEAGEHTVEYNLTAQTPGICHALPTVVQAMYAPEIRAESGDDRVEVIRK